MPISQRPGSRPAERAQDGRLAQLQILKTLDSTPSKVVSAFGYARMFSSLVFLALYSFSTIALFYFSTAAPMDRAVVAYDPVVSATNTIIVFKHVVQCPHKITHGPRTVLVQQLAQIRVCGSVTVSLPESWGVWIKYIS